MEFLTTRDDVQAAEPLFDALIGEGIATALKRGDHGIGIWVHHDKDLPRAQALLSRFESDPQAKEVQEAIARGQQLRARLAAEHRERFGGSGLSRLLRSPVAAVCLVASAAVFLATTGGDDGQALLPLFIALPQDVAGGHPFARIIAGEFWRLWTPAIIHFGFPHILFNAIWMLDLGTMIERRHGSALMAGLVLSSAAVSNVAQLLLGPGPTFGGLSGVVYALLGFAWLRGRFDPAAGYSLTRGTVGFLLAWLAAGFAAAAGVLDGLPVLGPLFSHMANYAHLGGLLVGCAMGYATAQLQRSP